MGGKDCCPGLSGSGRGGGGRGGSLSRVRFASPVCRETPSQGDFGFLVLASALGGFVALI